MKKGVKKKFFYKGIILIAILLAVLIILNILINNNVLLAPDDSSSTAQKGIIKTLGDAFFGGIFEKNASVTLGQYKVGISQILLLLLTALLVYSVSDFLPFLPDKDWVKWSVSLIVALLAFLFIDPATITGIVDTYGALGVALTSIFPLIILLAFHLKIKDNPRFAPYSGFLRIFLFSIFGLWMIMKWYNASTGPASQYSTIYLISALIAGVWVIIGDRVLQRFIRAKERAAHQAGMEQATMDQVERAKVKIEDLKQRLASATPIERGKLKARIDDLEDNIKELMGY